MKRALAEGWLNGKLSALAKSSASDQASLEQWYQSHKSEFVRPERIVVQEAVISAAAGKGNEALAKAKALEKASDAEGFLREGTRVGVVRERALTRPELDAELGKEGATRAFLMVRIGEVQLFPEGNGARALRLLRREGPLDISFEQARAQVASRRWYELRAAAMERLRAELSSARGVKLDEAAVERVMQSAPR